MIVLFKIENWARVGVQRGGGGGRAEGKGPDRETDRHL